METQGVLVNFTFGTFNKKTKQLYMIRFLAAWQMISLGLNRDRIITAEPSAPPHRGPLATLLNLKGLIWAARGARER
jgi:hypothetical protein